MNINLIAHTDNPEGVVATAAHICTNEAWPEGDNISTSIIPRVLKMGHMSILEHVSFSFAIDGISRVLSHQLVRHRIASYSQQSQRYVYSGSGVRDTILPGSIKANPDARNFYAKAINQCYAAYDNLLSKGIPQEDARFVLPNAAATKLVMTMNARELHHFLSLRLCNRAQWEIRALAHGILAECRKVAPLLFELAGPGCVRGKCPEGSNTCGEPWRFGE